MVRVFNSQFVAISAAMLHCAFASKVAAADGQETGTASTGQLPPATAESPAAPGETAPAAQTEPPAAQTEPPAAQTEPPAAAPPTTKAEPVENAEEPPSPEKLPPQEAADSYSVKEQRRGGSNRRDTWYIGFGLGGGWASTSFGSESENWGDVFKGTDSTRVSIEFEVGATLTPQLLLGGRIIAMREEAEENGVAVALQHNQYLANLTYFPLRNGEGLFLRAGVGLSALVAELSGSEFSGTASQGGFGAGLGLGYAIWLGDSFNMVLSNDFNFSNFGGDEDIGEATSGWFDAIHLGFYWY